MRRPPRGPVERSAPAPAPPPPATDVPAPPALPPPATLDPAPPAPPPPAIVADGDGGDAGQPAAKKMRGTRKVVAWIFMDKISDSKGTCRLGCLDKLGCSRAILSIASTTSIERHVEAKHPVFWSAFLACRNNTGNVLELEASVARKSAEIEAHLNKLEAHKDKFFKKIAKSLDGAVKSDLLLLLWAIENNVSRLALNAPTFDTFLRSALSSIPRHASSHTSLGASVPMPLQIAMTCKMSIFFS